MHDKRNRVFDESGQVRRRLYGGLCIPAIQKRIQPCPGFRRWARIRLPGKSASAGCAALDDDSVAGVRRDEPGNASLIDRACNCQQIAAVGVVGSHTMALGQPDGTGPAARVLFAHGEQVAQHRAGLDRGKLMGVAQEDEPAVLAERANQPFQRARSIIDASSTMTTRSASRLFS